MLQRLVQPREHFPIKLKENKKFPVWYSGCSPMLQARLPAQDSNGKTAKQGEA